MPKQRSETIGLKSTEWAAGLFEGEGYLSYSKTRDNWEFGMNMTDEDVVEDFGNLLDIKVTTKSDCNKSPSIIALKKHTGTTADYKPQWRARTYARDKIFEIVCELYPYMGERRRAKMDEFIKWYETK